MGRLGNFLFQAGAAFGYAKRHDLEFSVPSNTNDKYWNPLYLQHLVKPTPSSIDGIIHIREKKHTYIDLAFLEDWRNYIIILEGYFQSEKYFKDYRKELLKAFAFPWNPHNNVSIHVRRGDYLKYPHKHPVVPPQFYQEAVEQFFIDGYWDFHVFSDDINWCKGFFIADDNLFPNEVNFIFHEGGSEIDDLIGISNCAGGHINSSSTFAWWGAWLNQNPQKIVITPKQWFVPGHGGLDTSDIIPESWIKL